MEVQVEISIRFDYDYDGSVIHNTYIYPLFYVSFVINNTSRQHKMWRARHAHGLFGERKVQPRHFCRQALNDFGQNES